MSESDPGQLTELEEDGTLATGTAVAGLAGAGTDGTGAAGGKGAVGGDADPPLELTIASKPDCSTEVSDVRTTVRDVPEELMVVPLPSEPLNRPSCTPLVPSPSYTVTKS